MLQRTKCIRRNVSNETIMLQKETLCFKTKQNEKKMLNSCKEKKGKKRRQKIENANAAEKNIICAKGMYFWHKTCYFVNKENFNTILSKY